MHATSVFNSDYSILLLSMVAIIQTIDRLNVTKFRKGYVAVEKGEKFGVCTGTTTLLVLALIVSTEIII